jgi:hypothetical protein
VIGDLFQQYAAKYIGIGRGIPLSNTNQLWGLAWGVLVFGELRGQGATAQALVAVGSLVMIAGALTISRAEASEGERRRWDEAMARECDRYGLDRREVEAAVGGDQTAPGAGGRRRWWEALIVAGALGVFALLASQAGRQELAISASAAVALGAATAGLLAYAAWMLWKRTRFA